MNVSFTAPVPTLARPIINKPTVRKNINKVVEKVGSPRVIMKTTKDKIISKNPEINLVALPALLKSSLLIETKTLDVPDNNIITVKMYIRDIRAALVKKKISDDKIIVITPFKIFEDAMPFFVDFSLNQNHQKG